MNTYLEKLPGSISFYYKNLVTGQELSYRKNEKMFAASVIKLYIMADAFYRISTGALDPDQIIVMKKEYYVPSCGAVAYMHEGLEVTVMDLITLMIIFSDNTATNILIDLLGIEQINEEIRKLGYEDVWLRRKMYDTEKSKRGIQNQITAKQTAVLLEQMYQGTLIDSMSSEKMISIMKNQQVNGKIPFYLNALDPEPEIAHKTGEDSKITHDVGIIYAKQPFIVCFCGNETDTPAYERVMAEMSLQLYQENNK
ncbi:MAG: serine hydrolase [Lachnospiraceae bacterium]|nr:serine hydrolase [Lachnospiraceae bacterium]